MHSQQLQGGTQSDVDFGLCSNSMPQRRRRLARSTTCSRLLATCSAGLAMSPTQTTTKEPSSMACWAHSACLPCIILSHSPSYSQSKPTCRTYKQSLTTWIKSLSIIKSSYKNSQGRTLRSQRLSISQGKSACSRTMQSLHAAQTVERAGQHDSSFLSCPTFDEIMSGDVGTKPATCKTYLI